MLSMKAICVDDEKQILGLVVSLCEELTQLTEVKGFDKARDALSYLEKESVDLAILDIDMPDMDGIELARQIKELRPDTAVIFLTGYSEYAVKAFELHASGYLMKPVSRERLAAEVEYALAGRKSQMEDHIFARTFGEFDLYVDGEQVHFKRSKSKELLAYLIDRQGSSVTRPMVFAALWGDEEYSASKQKYLDVIIRSLRSTLAEYGISEIMENRRGLLRVFPDRFSCDLYRFFDGDADVVNSYHGEYMNSYEWAGMKEAWIDRKYSKLNR